jgi:hypothetical protein
MAGINKLLNLDIMHNSFIRLPLPLKHMSLLFREVTVKDDFLYHTFPISPKV